jgi:hypothetical protein
MHRTCAALDLRQHLGQVVLDPSPRVVAPPRQLTAVALDRQDQPQRPPGPGLFGDAHPVSLAVDLDDGKHVLGAGLHPMPFVLRRLGKRLNDHQCARPVLRRRGQPVRHVAQPVHDRMRIDQPFGYRNG